MRRCVWSRNLKHEVAVARVGLQRHREEEKKVPSWTTVHERTQLYTNSWLHLPFYVSLFQCVIFNLHRTYILEDKALPRTRRDGLLSVSLRKSNLMIPNITDTGAVLFSNMDNPLCKLSVCHLLEEAELGIRTPHYFLSRYTVRYTDMLRRTLWWKMFRAWCSYVLMLCSPHDGIYEDWKKTMIT